MIISDTINRINKREPLPVFVTPGEGKLNLLMDFDLRKQIKDSAKDYFHELLIQGLSEVEITTKFNYNIQYALKLLATQRTEITPLLEQSYNELTWKESFIKHAIGAILSKPESVQSWITHSNSWISEEYNENSFPHIETQWQVLSELKHPVWKSKCLEKLNNEKFVGRQVISYAYSLKNDEEVLAALNQLYLKQTKTVADAKQNRARFDIYPKLVLDDRLNQLPFKLVE